VRAAQAHAGRVEDGVGEGRGDRADRAFAGAGGRQLGAVQQHDVDCFGRLGDVEDRVARPIDTRHLGAVEGDLLGQGAVRALHDITVDAAPEPVGVDDQPAIMGDGEFARPHLAGMAVNLDLGDDRHHRTRALRIRNAAPGQGVAIAVGPRRGPWLPADTLGRRLDDGDLTRLLYKRQETVVTQRPSKHHGAGSWFGSGLIIKQNFFRMTGAANAAGTT